jgi:hypothetical protein
MITTKRREIMKLSEIVRELERMADAEQEQNKRLGRWLDLNTANHWNGQKMGARKVLAKYKGQF